MSDNAEYIAVGMSRTGKVEDVAVCNAYSLALQYANDFAACAPLDAVITVYECKPLRVSGGRIEEPEHAIDAP